MKFHPSGFRLPWYGALVLVVSFAWGRAAVPTLELEPVAVDQCFSPTAVVHAGDGSGRIFVADQVGLIRVFKDGYVMPEPFLDLSAKLVELRAAFDERGLLGLAFHPDYAEAGQPGEGLFYVYYSAPSPGAPGTAADPVDHRSVVAEFRVSEGDPEVADGDSERVLFTVEQPQFNHNGGQLAFGPLDGMLYVSLGDGGSANDNNAGHTGGSNARPANALGNAQDRTRLLGKVLRIDPLGTTGPGGGYGIPADNPFVGEGNGVRAEIHAYGLRNPWKFSFDDGPGGTNRLFLADVGQGKFEEINVIVAGGNYGWRRFEGTSIFEAATPSVGPYEDPVAEYAHPGQAGATGLPEVGLSVTGGHVYRGSAIPGLQGVYVFGDWSEAFATPRGTLLALEEDTPGNFALSRMDLIGGNPLDFYLPAFGEDEDGEILVATKRVAPPMGVDPESGRPTGSIFRLVVPRGPVELVLTVARDTTIFSEGALSSGAGNTLFAGRTGNGALRRALLAFDLSGVPEGAMVTGATLGMRMTKTSSDAANIALHRVQGLWGEASSNSGTSGSGAPAQTGDATWSESLYSTFGGQVWNTPGGDFVAETSAETVVDDLGSYVWNGAGLAADLQTWLDDPGIAPESNPGWILLGNEAAMSAKSFASREAVSADERPRLTLTYTTAPPLSHRIRWERRYFPVGMFVDPSGDGDFDGIQELLEYAWGLDPTRADTLESAFTSGFDEGNQTFALTFRRDPLAVDLVYELQVGGDLGGWTTVVESVGGAAPTGAGFVEETVDALDPSLRRVTARDPVGFPEGDARYARLKVSRP